MKKMTFEEFCIILENKLRSLGKDTTVMFLENGVSIAPPKWPADIFEKNLYLAVKETEKIED